MDRNFWIKVIVLVFYLVGILLGFVFERIRCKRKIKHLFDEIIVSKVDGVVYNQQDFIKAVKELPKKSVIVFDEVDKHG